MVTDDGFLRAILDAPDDVGLRLSYADWLDERGDPRGEFIRVQCELASLPEDSPRRGELQKREKQLLEQHASEWVGPLRDLVEKREFRRGFVEGITVEDTQFLENADAIFRLAPVRHCEFGSWHDCPERTLPALAASPYLERLRTIELGFGVYQVGDRDFQALASSPTLLQRLERLFVVECSISPVGLNPVLMSPHLRHLRVLSLSECVLEGTGGVKALADSPNLTRLAHLYLHKNALGNRGVRRLVASPNCRHLETLELSACGLTDDGARYLAQSRHLAGLMSLWLDDNDIGHAGAQALADSPQIAGVQFLYLHGNHIGDKGAAALASSPHLNGLKALILWSNNITERGRALLETRFGQRVHTERTNA